MRHLLEERFATRDTASAAVRDLATAVKAANRLAKLFGRDRATARRFYTVKNALLDSALTLCSSDVRVRWHRLPAGNHSVLVSLGSYCSMHSFFSELSPASRCRIVSEIGPEPEDVPEMRCGSDASRN